VVLREYDGIDIDGAVIVDGFPASTVTAVIAAGLVLDFAQPRLEACDGSLTMRGLPGTWRTI